MRRVPGVETRAILVVAVGSVFTGACGGGSPLLHPARTLAAGDVRAAGGLSANIAVGSPADDVRTARELAAKNPDIPGAPGGNPAYAKGALVAAAIGPGLAPFVAARVGVGDRYEGGVAYTGRAARIDMRRSFDRGAFSLSLGAGVTGVFYGRQEGSSLPAVDLSELHGYGADVPVLVGWQSDAGLYMAWAGLRAGWEHDAIESLTSEPKVSALGSPSVHLSGERFYGAGVLGVGTGFRHVHVAIELDVAYQTVTGDFNATHVNVHGLTLVPASALWWNF